MFKKIFITLVVLAVLVFGGLSVYVSTIDWNLHKNKIAKQFEEISGKKIVFEGPVSLSFFPSPYLSAKNIKIFNQTGENTAQPLAVIQEMVTDIGLVPLLKGNFVIDNMTLLNANILIEFLPNGKLNWYSEITDSQRNKIDNVEVALNSVLLKDATAQIINEGLGINTELTNLNAEVMAESLVGPYRIDGNFVKDNNPAGFALNLGTLNENFATSVNLVLTHPNSDSYARFDGSMLSSNKEFKGNLVIDSKKPSNFINDLTNQVIVPAEYNYPLACTIELITNDQQIDLSSFIIKYGEKTAGAGNILIPLAANSDEEKRKIEAAFEMTDVDLVPIIGVLKQHLKKYDNKKTDYAPYFDFDLIADITSVQAYYNDKIIRNAALSINLINDVISIKELSGLLPGDTEMTVNGDIFESEKVLSYAFNIKTQSQDFYKFMEMFNIQPKTYAQATYRNATAELGVSGNLNQIKIAPFKFQMDKTTSEGIIGIVRNDRNNLFISLNTDSINFDNYLPKLSPEEQKLPLTEKIKLELNKLKFLNNYDITFESKLALGIYEGMSLEDLNLKFATDKDSVKISDLSIKNFHNAQINLSGEIKNIGNQPNFKNVKYTLKTDKLNSFMDKIGIDFNDSKLISSAKNIKAKGIFTGNLKNINIKSVTSLDKLNTSYSGRIYNGENGLSFLGKLEFKTPDFVDFINKIGLEYNPQYMSANLFTFKADISSDAKSFNAKNIDSFIGSNNFNGDFSVVKAETPQITANITSNKIELDRFIPVKQQKNKTNKKIMDTDNVINFIEKPNWSNSLIDYSVFNGYELTGNFATENLNIVTTTISDAKANINIKQGNISVSEFTGSYNNILFTSNFDINTTKTPTIKAKVTVPEFGLNKLGGKKYEFTGGVTTIDTEFSANASSELEFIKTLTGKFSFSINDTIFNGWDISTIESDLTYRSDSEGLFEMLNKNLTNGQTNFYSVKTEFDIKNGIAEFVNSEMLTNGAKISISGSADLQNWETNSSFILTLEQLTDKIPPIEYGWNGRINNPNLTISSYALKEKYDSYWAKIHQEQEQAEQSRIDALNQRMSETQENVQNIMDTLNEDIFPRLEKYPPMSSNITTKTKYDSSKTIADDIQNQLVEMQNRVNEEFTDEDITQMNVNLEVFEPQLADMLRELDETYIIDLKNLSNNVYETTKNVYDYSLKKGINYENTLNAYANRLIEIKSLVILDNEPNIADLKNNVETSLRAIGDFHNKALEINNLIEGLNDINDLESQYQIIQEVSNKSQNEMEQLNTHIKDLFTATKNLVAQEDELAIRRMEAIKAAQERIYQEQQKIEEENKPKSKIIIIEEGQTPDDVALIKPMKIQEPEIIEEQKPVKENINENNSQPVIPTIKVENPFANAEPQPIVEETPMLEPVTLPEAITVKAPVIKEEPVIQKTPFIAAEPKIEEEKVIEKPVTEKKVIVKEEPVKQEPILKPVATSAYRSKITPSGIIVKPAKSKKSQNSTAVNTENEPLLKPLRKSNISSSGTIIKRK